MSFVRRQCEAIGSVCWSMPIKQTGRTDSVMLLCVQIFLMVNARNTLRLYIILACERRRNSGRRFFPARSGDSNTYAFPRYINLSHKVLLFKSVYRETFYRNRSSAYRVFDRSLGPVWEVCRPDSVPAFKRSVVSASWCSCALGYHWIKLTSCQTGNAGR